MSEDLTATRSRSSAIRGSLRRGEGDLLASNPSTGSTSADQPPPEEVVENLPSASPALRAAGSRAFTPYRRTPGSLADAPGVSGGASGDGAENRLVVGPNIRFKGEISSCTNLIVEGRVEASMNSERIAVAESGTFIGEAHVDHAEIAGRFEGKLVARVQLILRASGRLNGTVAYGDLTIEPGGRLAGDIAPLDDQSS